MMRTIPAGMHSEAIPRTYSHAVHISWVAEIVIDIRRLGRRKLTRIT
jgi:hypothetical protein